MNEISDAELTSSNVRISEIERNTVERLEPTMKVQVYIQDSKVKNIDKHTKKKSAIRFWDETNKKAHKSITSTPWSHRHMRR